MNVFGSSWLRPVAAVCGLLLAVAWMAGLFDEKMAPGLLEIPAVGDNAFLVAERRVQRTLETVPGTLRAKQATLVSSRILARISKIHVRAGDTVHAGDLLIQLEQTDARARLEQSRNQVQAIAARSHEAGLSLARALNLRERKLNAVADVDKARASEDALKAELAAAEEAVIEAAAALQFTQIESPIEGKVVDRFAEPGDTATPGETLLSLYNPLTLRVEAQVREQLAVKLTLGQELPVNIPALERTSVARIDELVPAADPGSRSFLVKARVDFDSQLRPGMYARMLIPGETSEKILLPVNSVVHVGQLDVIWVQRDGVITRRFVIAGAVEADGMITILSGLKAGEKVLLAPPQ